MAFHMVFIAAIHRVGAAIAPKALAVAAVLVLADPSWAAQPQTLLVFGDSLVAGYGLEDGKSFPDALQRRLRAGGRAVDVINGGISGDTTAGGASRIGWALADRPDAVVVVLGGNDALRGLPPRAMEDNLDAIMAAIQDQGLPLLLAGMKAPANMGPDYGREFDKAFANALQKARQRVASSGTGTEGEVFFYPFFLDGVALEPELNLGDGIHPNPDGIAEITGRILPIVVQLLDAAAKRDA